MPFEVRHYVTAAGDDVFAEWFAELGDRQAQARIQADIKRAKDYRHDYKERTSPQGRRPG
jgi:putative component of toxin-antitoxin plasmid stabilization module